jgi:hypothetical protein
VVPSQASIRWSLVRYGHTYQQGVVLARKGTATLRVPGINRLRPGRYVVRIAGRRGTAFRIG